MDNTDQFNNSLYIVIVTVLFLKTCKWDIAQCVYDVTVNVKKIGAARKIKIRVEWGCRSQFLTCVFGQCTQKSRQYCDTLALLISTTSKMNQIEIASCTRSY